MTKYDNNKIEGTTSTNANSRPAIEAEDVGKLGVSIDILTDVRDRVLDVAYDLLYDEEANRELQSKPVIELIEASFRIENQIRVIQEELSRPNELGFERRSSLE